MYILFYKKIYTLFIVNEINSLKVQLLTLVVITFFLTLGNKTLEKQLCNMYSNKRYMCR